MDYFNPTQWLIVALVFLLGLIIGMAIMAGGKWKRAYREQNIRMQELERENEQLRREAREYESLRGAALRNPAPDPAARGPL